MLALHVAGVLSVLAAGWLGQWQLGAWHEHRQDRVAQMATEAPRPLQDVIGRDEAFPADGVGRPVDLAGTWLPDSTFYVSGRLQDGQTGLWMVTAMSTCGSAGTVCKTPSAIPVVLGWTPGVAEAPAPPSGELAVTGWLQPGDAAGDPDPDPTDDVLTSLRIAEVIQRVDQDLYGGFVILRDPAGARTGLVAVTPDSLPKAPAFTGLRNLLYGVEWWCFGAFAVFLWFRWSRDEVLRAQRPAPEDRLDPDRDEQPGPARLPSQT